MQILKNGNNDTNWVGECVHCASIIMADVSEVKVDNKNKGIVGITATADCPQCDTKKSVNLVPLMTNRAKTLLRKHDLNWKEIVENLNE